MILMLLIALAGVMVFAAFVVYVLIPRARVCIAQDHPECWRDRGQLLFARRWLQVVRVIVGLFWLTVLGLDILAPFSFGERVGLGAYLGMLLVLWINLGFPPPLQRRLDELEAKVAAPWEALP